MPLELDAETRARLLASIKRFAAEDLDLDLGDLKADLFLDFCVKEIGPEIYNRAVDDALAHVMRRVEEAPGVVHADGSYWRR